MTVREPDGLFQQAINYIDSRIHAILKPSTREASRSFKDAAGVEHRVQEADRTIQHFFKHGSEFEEIFNDMLLSPSMGKLLKKIEKYNNDSKLQNLTPAQRLIVLKAIRTDLANAIKGREKLIQRIQKNDLKSIAESLAHRLWTFNDASSLQTNVDRAWTSLGELDKEINQLNHRIAESAQEVLPVAPQAQPEPTPAKSNLRVIGDWDNLMDELTYLGGKLAYDDQNKTVVRVERKPGLPLIQPLQVGRKKESKAIVSQLLDDIERIQQDGTPQERREIDVLIEKMEKPENSWLNAFFDQNSKYRLRLANIKENNAIEGERKGTLIEKTRRGKTDAQPVSAATVLSQVDKRLEQSVEQYQTIEQLLDKITNPEEEVFRNQFIYGARSVFKTEELVAAFDKRIKALKEKHQHASPAEKKDIQEQAKILFDVANQMVTQEIFSRNELKSAAVQKLLTNIERMRQDTFPKATALSTWETAKPKTRATKRDELRFLSSLEKLSKSQTAKDREATLKELVRGFSGIQAARYKNVKFAELYNQAWTKDEKNSKSPNVVNSTANFNQLTAIIAGHIVDPTLTKEERARLLEGLIDLEHSFIKEGDFADALIIQSSLSTSSISRLDKTWALVSEAHKQKHKMHEEQSIDSISNFKKYRHKVAAYTDMKAIPLLNTVLGEITTMDENRKNFDEELDHLEKSTQKLSAEEKETLNPQIKAKTDPLKEGAKQRVNVNKIALFGRYFAAMQKQKDQIPTEKVGLEQLTPQLESLKNTMALQRYQKFLAQTGSSDEKNLVTLLQSKDPAVVQKAIDDSMYVISKALEPK